MASRMAERVSHIGERARERTMDKVDRENDKLRSEVRMLREDLQEERGVLQEALQAMKRHETITVKTKKRSGLGRLLRTLVIGGGAYVLDAGQSAEHSLEHPGSNGRYRLSILRRWGPRPSRCRQASIRPRLWGTSASSSA